MKFSDGVTTGLTPAAEDYDKLRAVIQRKFPAYDLEIRDGEPVVVSPHDALSSTVVVRLTQRLLTWADAVGGWRIFESNGGFRFEDGDLFAPDVTVISKQRLPKLPPVWATGIPEAAFEVRSSSGPPGAVRRKVQLMLEKGCDVVVLVEPRVPNVEVYRSGAEPQRVRDELALPELPGFRIAIADLLRDWPPSDEES